jgi:hypothetical protein
MDARRFFTSAIPTAIARDFEQFMALSGTIACQVRGVGSWTLHLGNVEEPIVEGFDNHADLKVWFTQKSFDDFLGGKLNAKVIMKEREIAYAGDVALLERLGYLLAPGGSPLATRLAAH